MPLDAETLPLALDDPNRDTGDDPRFWIDTQEFAELAGIHRKNGHLAITRCLAGREWRNTALQVRLVGSVGGNGGQAYQVFVPSLPLPLANAWKAKHPALFKTVEVPKVRQHIPPQELVRQTDPRRRGAIEKGEFIEALIKPALLYPKHGRSRTEAVRKICAAMPVTFPNGRSRTFDERGISRLIAKYEAGGLPALIQAPRREEEAPRVLVSRSFDKAAPFSETEKAEIWAELRQHIKNLFLGTRGTIPQIERLANVRLVELARAKGWGDASLDNCQVGLAQVRKFAALRIAASKSLDAGKYAAHFKPRVIRGRADLQPMEIVMGDVHPVDILNLRDDGSEATARMVSWLDLATNRLMSHVFLFEKGKSITQAHIAASFVQMVRAWGMPSILYLDNGSEYIWQEMMDGFTRLAQLVQGFNAYVMNAAEIDQRIEQADGEDANHEDDPRTVVRSTPHNPQGKAPAEGLFSVLERSVFCFIPGWIGGDRMNKKTQRVGQKPRAFKGTWPQFEAAMKTAMDYYHARPQKNGSSPNEKFARHVKAGWAAVDVDYIVLLMAIAERKPYKVLNTGIEIAGTTYWHDIMATPSVMGSHVLVYYAKWDTDQVIVLPRNAETGKFGNPVIAYRAREYGMVDKTGAIESGRRISIMNKSIREMKQGSRPVDAVGEMGKFVQLSPPATVVPFGQKITLPDDEFQGIREAAAQAGTPPKVEHVRLLPGQWFDHQTGQVRSMYDQPGERETAPGDDWEAEERARLIQEARDAETAGDMETEEPSGGRLTAHG
jgi:hypothetical protein